MPIARTVSTIYKYLSYVQSGQFCSRNCLGESPWTARLSARLVNTSNINSACQSIQAQQELPRPLQASLKLHLEGSCSSCPTALLCRGWELRQSPCYKAVSCLGRIPCVMHAETSWELWDLELRMKCAGCTPRHSPYPQLHHGHSCRTTWISTLDLTYDWNSMAFAPHTFTEQRVHTKIKWSPVSAEHPLHQLSPY